MSHGHHLSPAGYQRRHEAKGYAETGEVLDARRRNLGEKAPPITVRGKWRDGIRMADRVVVLMSRLQQNKRGGKDPDRWTIRCAK
jgi:hypothetical protein